MNDLSKFDMTAPWFEFLRYQNDCKLLGKEDSVQRWQENRGDIKKPKQKKAPKPEGWGKEKPIKKVSTDVIDNPKTKKSVEIIFEGKAYPSISAAAKAHGVSAQTISRRLGRYKK